MALTGLWWCIVLIHHNDNTDDVLVQYILKAYHFRILCLWIAKEGFEGGNTEKEGVYSGVQDDKYLFLTNQESKREISSFYLPGTNIFSLSVMSRVQLLEMYTLQNLCHTTS